MIVHENWDRLDLLIFGKPKPEELDFNRAQNSLESRPTIISADEEITIEVFDRVRQSVVNITATTLTLNFWRQIIPEEGQGSGFVIDDDGYVLTNNHVVAKAQKITVTMGSGKKTDAILVGRDPSSDLAVVKIPRRIVSAVASLGDSGSLRVGQKAIAIGNPFGLSHTLTTGIVSALNRQIQGEDGSVLYDLIQTDAAINPGNSDGPLLNSNAEVIGINTAIFSLSGGYQGIGFAIPVNRARDVASQLISTGRYIQPWLGISGMTLSEELARPLKLGVDEGILVVAVVPGSSAYQAGLKGGRQDVVIGNLQIAVGGDIIVAMNDKKVSAM
ncbi:MAG: S1C family serine protease, partial [Nitrospinales bacterium]